MQYFSLSRSLVTVSVALSALHHVQCFTVVPRFSAVATVPSAPTVASKRLLRSSETSPLNLFGGNKDSLADDAVSDGDIDSSGTSSVLQGDQLLVGIAGTVASIIVFYSEFTLKTTGCGLPAGPFGLLGAVEGVSYLGVIGIVAYSLYSKITTGRGLPAGPAGLLGAAEGLSFLAIVAGLVVLGFQIMDYGYIPNAVPMEGGMCS